MYVRWSAKAASTFELRAARTGRPQVYGDRLLRQRLILSAFICRSAVSFRNRSRCSRRLRIFSRASAPDLRAYAVDELVVDSRSGFFALLEDVVDERRRDLVAASSRANAMIFDGAAGRRAARRTAAFHGRSLPIGLPRILDVADAHAGGDVQAASPIRRPYSVPP